MMTLREFLKHIQTEVDKDPDILDAFVCACSDEEINEVHLIDEKSPTTICLEDMIHLFNDNDIAEPFLEMLENEEEVSFFRINVIG